MRKIKICAAVLLLVFAVAFMFSCGEKEESDGLQIVATVFPQYDFAYGNHYAFARRRRYRA